MQILLIECSLVSYVRTWKVMEYHLFCQRVEIIMCSIRYFSHACAVLQRKSIEVVLEGPYQNGFNQRRTIFTNKNVIRSRLIQVDF